MGARERALRTALDPLAVFALSPSASPADARRVTPDGTTAAAPRADLTAREAAARAAATPPPAARSAAASPSVPASPAAPRPASPELAPPARTPAPPTAPRTPVGTTDAPDQFTASPSTAASDAAGIEPLPAPLRFAADAARASLTAGRPEKALTLLEGAWPETASAELHALKAEGLLELGRDTESLDAAARGVLRSPQAAAPRWVAAQAALRLDAPAHAAAFLGPLLAMADARVLRSPAPPAEESVQSAAMPEGDVIEAHVVEESALRSLVPQRAAAALATLADHVLVQADLARTAERESPRSGQRRSAYDQRRLASLAAAAAALPLPERRAIAEGDGVERVRAWVAARAGQAPGAPGRPSAIAPDAAGAGDAVSGEPGVVEIGVWTDGAVPTTDGPAMPGARRLGVQLDVLVDDGFAVASPAPDEATAPADTCRPATPGDAGVLVRLLPAAIRPPAAAPPGGRADVQPDAAPEGSQPPAGAGDQRSVTDVGVARPAATWLAAGAPLAASPPGEPLPGTAALPFEGPASGPAVPPDRPSSGLVAPALDAPPLRGDRPAVPGPVLDPAGGEAPVPPSALAPEPAPPVRGAPVPEPAPPTSGAPSPAVEAAEPSPGAPPRAGEAAPPETVATLPPTGERSAPTLTDSPTAAEAMPASRPEIASASEPAPTSEPTPAPEPAVLAPRDLPAPADPALLVAWLGVDAEVTRLGPAAAGLSVPAAAILADALPRPRPDRRAPPVTWRGAVRLALVGAALVLLAADRPWPAAVLAGTAVWWWRRDGRRAVQLAAGKAATAAR